MRSIFFIPSDEMPVSRRAGATMKEEGKMRSIFFIPSDEMPVSRRAGVTMKEEGNMRRQTHTGFEV